MSLKWPNSVTQLGNGNTLFSYLKWDLNTTGSGIVTKFILTWDNVCEIAAIKFQLPFLGELNTHSFHTEYFVLWN